MSRRRPPWSSLGIDPTSDERAIKRGYAAKLKAIDVEVEPAKFIALRKRLEDALWQAQWIHGGEEADIHGDFGDDAADFEAGEEAEAEAGDDGAAVVDDRWSPADAAPTADAAPPLDPLPDRASPWAVPDVDRVEARFAAIEALLRRGGEGRDGAIDREVRALWTEPAIETVDGAQDAEHRLAHMALDHGAAASFLLRLAGWHYGWVRRAQMVGTQWPISEVGQRAAAENWIVRIENGAIVGHSKQVIDELRQGPSGHWWRNYFPKRRIMAFLDELRQRFPEGEYRFDADIVAAWERVRNPGISLGSLFGLVILGAIILIAVSRSAPGEGLGNPAFWGFFVAGIGGIAALRWGIRRVRPTRPSRYGGPLTARQVGAFAAMLALFALAALLPANWGTGIALAVASAALLPATGAALPAEEERDSWLWSLFNGRYVLMAAGLFGAFAMVQAPQWVQAIAPGLLGAAAAHLLRERLVASWQTLSPAALVGARAALLAAAVILAGFGFQSMPDFPAAPVVIAGVLLLLVQDAAANAWRQPISTAFYFAYIVLLVLLVAFPHLVPMALVIRRLADRLFVRDK